MSIYSQYLSKTSHYLGIDFGSSKIGLAMADTETKIAFGFDTIKNNKNSLVKLEEIIAERNVKMVVIGIPSYIFPTRKKYDQKTLGKLLEKNTGIKVHYAEEMFSSKMAQANLREKGARQVEKKDDKEAARITLQNWLDKL